MAEQLGTASPNPCVCLRPCSAPDSNFLLMGTLGGGSGGSNGWVPAAHMGHLALGWPRPCYYRCLESGPIVARSLSAFQIVINK